MNRNNFPNYQYYQQPQQSYSQSPDQSWNGWPVNAQQQQQQQPPPPQHYSSYPRNAAAQFTGPPPPSPNTPPSRPESRTQNFFTPPPHANTNNRYYSQPRYNSPNAPNTSQNWQRGNYYGHKRQLSESSENFEVKNKPNKKKKKPLSQNKPSKKNWTIEEAKQALDAEKEYNKRTKNQLMIRFPDLDLNRDIVSKFHSAIENVHFQQSSMPRYCYVTIDEGVDIDDVIQQLNRTPFGDGFLKAEYKKDREEDHNVDPKDIDPLTLYVGNLAQEVTKEDVVKAYPKQRRIDIGYAKKMKYTRYAFVSFKNIQDSIEAFINTHSTEMYSKSLIVRFRRLHGTVGMPGEAKPQNEPRTTDEHLHSDDESTTSTLPHLRNHVQSTAYENKEALPPIDKSETVSIPSESPLPAAHSLNAQVDLNLVKREPCSDDEGEPANRSQVYDEVHLTECVNAVFANHKPMIKQEAIKQERVEQEEVIRTSIWDNSVQQVDLAAGVPQIKSELVDSNHIKKEIDDRFDDGRKYSDDDDDDVEEDEDNNFNLLLNNMETRARKIRSIQKILP